MRILDISVAVRNAMPVYPGDPEVEVQPVTRISKGDSSNTSLLHLPSHTATHVDPPLHFVEGGLAVDELDLDDLIGGCWVCDLGDVPVIDARGLEAAVIPSGETRVLLKTRNSGLWTSPSFRKDYTYLDATAASWLVNRGVRLVGIDYLSIEALDSPDNATHRTLLQSGIVVAEGLDLSEVSPGRYALVCLPLKVAGGDGAPARAVLISP